MSLSVDNVLLEPRILIVSRGRKSVECKKIIRASIGDTLIENIVLSWCNVFKCCSGCGTLQEGEKWLFTLKGHGEGH